MVTPFIQKYLQRGFGSMNKNDFEVFIFNEIITDTNYAGMNDYGLSVTLAIPQSKVKRLRYEANLKYGQNNAEAYSQRFRELLLQAKPQAINNGNAVKFCMEDKGLYLYIDNLLKQDGRFGDRSFNSELMVISMNDLVYLLENTVLTDDEKNDILTKYRKAAKDNNITLPYVLLEIAKAFAKGAGKGLTGGWEGVLWDFAADNIGKLIQWIIKQQKNQ